MITWMQKHKKYLVITIWISTIAFVGAGFVGWGAYDFNKNRATSVAQVGDRTISYQKLEKTYSDIYGYYANASGGKFTQDDADKMGLDKIAMASLIQETLLLDFADDLGLAASERDVAMAIAKDEAFQTGGKFDAAKYKKTLQSARISAKDFENELKDRLLLDKLFGALKMSANDADAELLGAGFFMQDKISAKVIEFDKSALNPSEDELKALWEKTKGNYLTKTKFELETKFIPQISIDANETALMAFYEENRGNYRDAEDKILSYEAAKNDVKNDYALKNTKRTALETYLKVKKGEMNAEDKATVSEDSEDFPLSELAGAKPGDVIKPFEYKNGFLIVKLVSIIKPEVKDFAAAREEVLAAFVADAARSNLEKSAKAALENFEGSDIGFISKDSQTPVLGLSMPEFALFVDRVFATPNKQGYVLLGEKAVVYKILEQKLLDEAKIAQYKELLIQNAETLKNDELQRDLLNALQTRYKIKQYYKGNNSGN